MKKIFGLVGLLLTIYTTSAQDVTLPSTNYETQYQASLPSGLVSPSISLFNVETASADLNLEAKLVFNSVLFNSDGTIKEGAKSFFPKGWETNIIPAVNKIIHPSGATQLEDEFYFSNPNENNPADRPPRDVPNLYAFDTFGVHGKFYFEEVNDQMILKIIQSSGYVDIDADFTYKPSSEIDVSSQFTLNGFTITDQKGFRYEFSTIQFANFCRHPSMPTPGPDFYGDVYDTIYKKSFLITKVKDKFNNTLLEYSYNSYPEVAEIRSHDFDYDQLYLENIKINGVGQIGFNLDTSTKKYNAIWLKSITNQSIQYISLNSVNSNYTQIYFRSHPLDFSTEKKYYLRRGAGSLTITQPTGGKIKYLFEKNDYGFTYLGESLPADFSFENTHDENIALTKTVSNGMDKFSFHISDAELQESEFYLTFHSTDPFWSPGLPKTYPPMLLLKPNQSGSLHTFYHTFTEANITNTLNQNKNQFPGNIFYIGGESWNSYTDVNVIKRTTFTDTADIKKEDWDGYRIKSIQLLDENNQITSEKEFIYTMPDEPNRSSGEVPFFATLDNHSYIHPMYSSLKQTIFYRRVTVKEEGKGKIVYDFDHSLKNIYKNYYILHSLTAIPSAQYKYDASNQLLENVENVVDVHNIDVPTGMIAEAEPILKKLTTTSDLYIAGSTTKKLRTITESTFDTISRHMTQRKITDVRMNETFEENHEYQKLGNAYYETAVKKYKNGTMINQSKAEYAPLNNGPLADAYALQKSSTAKGTQPFEVEREITLYDNKGNVLEYKTKEGTYVSQIWGYSDSKVVAELKNVRYDEISSTTISNIKAGTAPFVLVGTPSLEVSFESLRTAHSQGFITTYTYIPMVGIKTTTDANGRKETYQYDNSNRLYRILDHEGNIVKEYNYNIKN